MSGESLHARLPVPAGGTTYYANGATGDVTNGGTSLTLRSSGGDGVTNGTNTLTSASAAWSSGANPDVGHGIAILVGALWVYRKITAVGGAGTLTFNGATIAAGSSRSWRIGGPWQLDQDFYDKTSATSVSPAPGDGLEVMEWAVTLVGAIDASQTTLAVSSTAGFPASGTPFALQLESSADLARSYDGVTNGTNTLTSAKAQWDASMIGKQIWVQVGAEPGTWEKRIISAVGGAGTLTFSGATIAAGTLRSWRVFNMENVTVTSYSGTTMTVTRATHSSGASAHADGVRIDVPYMGKRATSYSDTGARHVVQSPGTSSAPFMVQNYAGHAVYFQANADTAVGTVNETLVLRSTARYWIFRRNPAGGSFTVERARDAGGSTNSPSIYFANSLDCEIEGLRTRFAQRGSGVLWDTTTQRCHAYGIDSRYNDVDLSFNHHGFYLEGQDCDVVNCTGLYHAYGNGIQVRVAGLNCNVVHNTFSQARGTSAHTTAGLWHEGACSTILFRNNLVVDSREGAHGSAASTGTGSSCSKNLVHGSEIGTGFSNVSTSTSLLNWNPGGSANYSMTGGAPNDNLTSDPLLAGRDTDNLRPLTGSPLFNGGDLAFTPPTDAEGTARAAGVATIGAFVAPEEVPSGNTITRSRRPMVIA